MLVRDSEYSFPHPPPPRHSPVIGDVGGGRAIREEVRIDEQDTAPSFLPLLPSILLALLEKEIATYSGDSGDVFLFLLYLATLSFPPPSSLRARGRMTTTRSNLAEICVVSHLIGRRGETAAGVRPAVCLPFPCFLCRVVRILIAILRD